VSQRILHREYGGKAEVDRRKKELKVDSQELKANGENGLLPRRAQRKAGEILRPARGKGAGLRMTMLVASSEKRWR
jgi:hypothetical protein